MAVLYYHGIIASALFSVFLGFYFLFSNRTFNTNREFFFLAMILSAISAAVFFSVLTSSGETSKKIITYLSILWFLAPYVFLRFAISLTGYNKASISKYLKNSFPLPFLLYFFTLKTNGLFLPFSKTSFGWTHIYNTRTLLFQFIFIYFTVFIVSGVLIIYLWGKKNKGSVKRHQANIVSASTLLLSLLVISYRYIISRTLHIIPPPLFPVFLNIWLGALAYAAFRLQISNNVLSVVNKNLHSIISDLLFIYDIKGEIIYVNESTIKISGFKKDELIGKNISLFLTNLPKNNSNTQKGFIVTSTGNKIPVSLRSITIKDSVGFATSYMVSAQDMRLMLSLEKQIEYKEKAIKNLKESEEKYLKVFNSNPSGLFIFDPEKAEVLEINDTVCSITGYQKKDLKSAKIIFKKIILKNPENRLLIHDILGGKSVIGKNCTIKSNTGQEKTILVSTENIYIDSNPCIVVSFVDITESQIIKSRLLRTQKMESIGSIAGGIAHDFNNILTVINGNIALAIEEPNRIDKREYLKQALKAGENAVKLTSQLLTFSKGGGDTKKIINCHSAIKSAAFITFTGKKVTPVYYLDAEEVHIKGNTNQLQQVFMNLFINAIHALDDTGEITISSRNDNKRENIIISVTDFGKGIPEKDLDTIFDPFYTTKKGGTGLGLAIVYSIIEKHNGTIEVFSSKEEGTTFTVTFPLAKYKS